MVIALDATYTLERQPSGVAVYSRGLIEALAGLETPHEFLLCYRLSRWRERREFLRPDNPRFRVRFFQPPLTFWLPLQADLFHSLAQRPPAFRFRREVVTIHDVFPLAGRDFSTPEFQQKFGRLLIEAARRAHRIITPSRYTADQVVKHTGVSSARIRVVPEGVEMPARALTAEERLRERDTLVGAGSLMVLSLGVIQTRKNTLNALRALALLPENYRLVLAGGEGHGAEAVHKFIREERLDSRVVRLGHVPADRIPALYQAADVLLYPSLEEGFGLPVLEAMAHALPVVASNTSSLPEVGGEAAVYANPHDPRDIAEKVRRAVENRALRTVLIEKGLARAREFTWRRTAELTLAVYDEVLRT
jgi:glycosyltransferase involved in cell wall biosynthesis